MKKSTLAQWVTTLAVCALVLPALASLDNPVTRPVKIHGNMTIVLNPRTGSAQFTDWGESTHTGLYTNSGWGVMNAAGQYIAGAGTVVAANGDTIDYVMGPTPNMVTYIGGTGRFQGVTGGFVATGTSRTPFVPNPDGTVTFKSTWVGFGEITY